jgi:hypothetical protein
VQIVAANVSHSHASSRSSCSTCSIALAHRTHSSSARGSCCCCRRFWCHSSSAVSAHNPACLSEHGRSHRASSRAPPRWRRCHSRRHRSAPASSWLTWETNPCSKIGYHWRRCLHTRPAPVWTPAPRHARPLSWQPRGRPPPRAPTATPRPSRGAEASGGPRRHLRGALPWPRPAARPVQAFPPSIFVTRTGAT